MSDKQFEILDLISEISKHKKCPICNDSDVVNFTYMGHQKLNFGYHCGTKMEVNIDRSVTFIEKCLIGRREDDISELLEN